MTTGQKPDVIGQEHEALPSKFRVRHTGTRWHLRFGSLESYEGLGAFAVNELQRILQSFVPEVLDVGTTDPSQSFEEAATQHGQAGYLVIMGTPEGNPFVARALEMSGESLPDHDEGYLVSSSVAPWDNRLRVILIAARTPRGVLYGVQDLNTTLFGAQTLWDDPIRVTIRDKLPVFARAETPRVARRGIWTWGYVIYDYRRFFDNMARLRLNTITIWNDCVPLNIDAVLEYAHARGVKVVLGFQWGWGMNLDLSVQQDRQRVKESVLAIYERDYAHLNHDGIYFQTLTETTIRQIGDQPVASVVCVLVNDICSELLDKHPDLHIQFGLHATSIMDDDPLLAVLDERVTITWEDAGTIPYSYDVSSVDDSPEATVGGNALDSLEGTIDYSRRVAVLRPQCPFSMVAKGFSKLNWMSEFENHGSFILGERSNYHNHLRLQQREPAWARKNVEWASHYRDAVRFFEQVLARNPDNALVTALVEDGLFEVRIQPCVALFAQILWNPSADHETMMRHMHSAALSNSL